MPKKAASTSLEPELYHRVERVAKVDRRSLAQIIELCVEKALPMLENESLKDAPSAKPLPEAKPVRYPALAKK